MDDDKALLPKKKRVVWKLMKQMVAGWTSRVHFCAKNPARRVDHRKSTWIDTPPKFNSEFTPESHGAWASFLEFWQLFRGRTLKLQGGVRPALDFGGSVFQG